MQLSNCKMSSTEGLFGYGMYNEKLKYEKYNSKYFFCPIMDRFKQKGSTLLDNGFPNIWNLEFMNVHNCMICSSVIIEKSILDIIQGFSHVRSGEDYYCWLKALKYTDSVYVPDICFYYDGKHGNGQLY
jgi:hypothetical protein